jgi:hypothetical protein
MEKIRGDEEGGRDVFGVKYRYIDDFHRLVDCLARHPLPLPLTIKIKEE